MNANKFIDFATITTTLYLIKEIADSSDLDPVKRYNVREYLEAASLICVVVIVGVTCSMMGWCSCKAAIYFNLMLVCASVLCKIAVIKTKYLLEDVSVASEVSLAWGFIATCLIESE